MAQDQQTNKQPIKCIQWRQMENLLLQEIENVVVVVVDFSFAIT